MKTQLIEHLLYSNIFIDDAECFVTLVENESTLQTYGFYCLTEYDLCSGFYYRANTLAHQMCIPVENIKGRLRNKNNELYILNYNGKQKLYKFTKKPRN